MTTPHEALQTILNLTRLSSSQMLPLDQCLGLVLAQEIVSPENVPPFANSAMDGFALRAADTQRASADSPIQLKIVGDLAAGRVAERALEPGMALRIMTGAPLPGGADTVVPVECTRMEGETLLLDRVIEMGNDVRLAGEDVRKGECVVQAETVLGPGELGVLASLGFSELPVFPKVRVAVITTGDELVAISEKPGPGQIRDSNHHSLCAQIRSFGAEPVPFPRIPDQKEAVAKAMREALDGCDLLLSTGGISVGDYDFVKTVLEEQGAEQIFWKVAQKPGGPLALYQWEGKLVFGIPGNPVAAMVMLEMYVRPALRKSMGHRQLFRPEVNGILMNAWKKSKPDGKTHFLRVMADVEQGHWHARLAGSQGSGVLSSMMRANALAVIPESVNALPAGGTVRLHLLENAPCQPVLI